MILKTGNRGKEQASILSILHAFGCRWVNIKYVCQVPQRPNVLIKHHVVSAGVMSTNIPTYFHVQVQYPQVGHKFC